jgi:hypothetical protein
MRAVLSKVILKILGRNHGWEQFSEAVLEAGAVAEVRRQNRGSQPRIVLVKEYLVLKIEIRIEGGTIPWTREVALGGSGHWTNGDCSHDQPERET